MSQQLEPGQPRPDDAVLGGQTEMPADGAMLGGIEGVRHRLKSSNAAVRIGALQMALNDRDVGLDLVIAALQDESLGVSWAAYELLEHHSEPKVQEALRRYGLIHAYEVVTVDVRGEIVCREARRTPIFRERLGSMVLDLVPIPGGHFRMGSPDSEKDRSEDESPQHEVSVPGFWMGQYAVTQAQYEVVMRENPSRFKGANCPVERLNWRVKGANRPVDGVDWQKAVEFCDRLSAQTGRRYRLPSEAEWEYACRAGTVTPFHYGETLTSELANYNGNYTHQYEPKGKYRAATTEVGKFPPNEYGLYDMHGNVWEWCLDHWHRNYEGAPTDGSAWMTGGNRDRRVLRGGSWFNYPWNCRSTCRGYYVPGYDDYDIGFRVVCELPRSVITP